MAEIDKQYRRQSIENVDEDLPYINLSFFQNLPIIKVCIVILFISVMFIPFLPPRYSSTSWHFPTSLADYWEGVKNVFYLFGILIGLVLIQDVLSNLRTFIERRCGYKKIAVFKIKKIWNLLAWKIVFLNNLHFFTLRPKDYGFNEIETGQMVETERTATHRFLDYQIITQ